MVSEEDAGAAGKDHYHLGGPGRDKDQPGVWAVHQGGPGAIIDWTDHRGGPGTVLDTLPKIQAG